MEIRFLLRGYDKQTRFMVGEKEISAAEVKSLTPLHEGCHCYLVSPHKLVGAIPGVDYYVEVDVDLSDGCS